MSFSHCTQAQYETSPALWHTGLIRMSNDARIEKRRSLERVLMQEIGADQPALVLGECRVDRKGFFHFIGARLKYLEQIAVPALEVLEHLGQLAGSGFGIERHDSIDDVVRPCPVGGIEVPRFGCRLEWAHDHSRRIGAQIETLPVQKRRSRQDTLDLTWAQSKGNQARKACSGAASARLPTVRSSWRISARLRRYETADSPPRFSLARSGCNPSQQLPVSKSINGADRSL